MMFSVILSWLSYYLDIIGTCYFTVINRYFTVLVLLMTNLYFFNFSKYLITVCLSLLKPCWYHFYGLDLWSCIETIFQDFLVYIWALSRLFKVYFIYPIPIWMDLYFTSILSCCKDIEWGFHLFLLFFRH